MTAPAPTALNSARRNPTGPLLDETWSLTIRATAAEAKKLSAIVSPSRNFEPTGRRGEYAMTSNSEVLSIRDADFLAGMGVEILSIEQLA